MYENKVILIGNLTKKPELKTTGTTTLTSLNIAINYKYKDQAGAWQEGCEYVSAVVFGKAAENCAQFLDKGQKVYVEGRIKNRVEEKEGEKRYHTGIVADRVQFGSKPQPKVENTTEEAPKQPTTRKRFEPIEYPENDINLEDMPF